MLRAVEQGPWPAIVRDLTQEGVGLITNQHFEPGTIIDIRLPVRTGDNLGMPRLVRVQHSSHRGGKRYRVGALFLQKLTREELASIPSDCTRILPGERRRLTRLRTQAKPYCKLIHATCEGPWHSVVKDISCKGIGLVTPFPFKEGMLLTVELPTKKLGERWLFRVHHVQTSSSTWWLLGGRFTRDLGADDLRALVS
ncbi:MAG: PilZ domain-containing protein [Gemmataceae bacterium]